MTTVPFLISDWAAFLIDMAIGRIVVGGADDQVDLGQDAALVGPVVMRERAARRFDTADPFVGRVR